MRLRRFFCCLLAFVFIFYGVFSVSAYEWEGTETINITDYIEHRQFRGDEIFIQYALPLDVYAEVDIYRGWHVSNNVVTLEGSEWHLSTEYFQQFISDIREDDDFMIRANLLGYNDGIYNVIDISDIKAGSNFDLDFYLQIVVDAMDHASNDGAFVGVVPNPVIYINWVDANGQFITSEAYSEDPFDFDGITYIWAPSFSFTVPDGAESFFIDLYFPWTSCGREMNIYFDLSKFKLYNYMSAFEENSKMMNQILEYLKGLSEGSDEEKKQTGLLQKIWDGITNLPNALLDGIVGLFVPSEEDMVGIKDQWEELLSSRFGAVYESSAIIDDFASAFHAGATQETITIPELNLNLAGTPFTFGGWEVDIIPDGFDFMIDTLKLIVDITCTFLFVNGMKKRLEGILV